MPRPRDDYIETALRELAARDEFLYRTKEGKWWVGGEYHYGGRDNGLRAGSPRSGVGFDTIREAIDACLARIEDEARRADKEAADQAARAAQLRQQAAKARGMTPRSA